LTVGVIAMWIKRWYGVPYIFEVGDLWPEAPIQMGFVKNSLLKSLLFRLEKNIYEKSLCVVALSSAIKENIESKIRNKEVYLIPNMADTCFYKPVEKIDSLKNKFDVRTEFVISYIGTMGLANGLEYLVECAALCQVNKLSVKFFLCGEGALLSHLQSMAKRMELKNLNFIPFQTRDGVKELMNVSDVVFVSYKALPVLETGSPNKYFDGLAAGKLIIINFGGWIKNEIENNQCGISVNPFDPSDFVKKIHPFISDKNLLASYQRSARALAEKMYSRKILSERFVSIITTATGKSNAIT
jgi:glycosyltransferase involved in cell wall biosynthesis